MDLLDLELVVAVAEAGSITHGAARVHLSLPSASARVRAVEESLGAALFSRDRRGVTVTAAGALVLRHARTVRTDLDRMRADLAEHVRGGATVRVLANAAATASDLIPAVTAFLAARPTIGVDLAERPSRQIVEAVAEHRGDLGVVTDSVNLGGLQTHVLRDDPLVVCTAPDDPLAGRDVVAFSDVAHRAFVGLYREAASPVAPTAEHRARLPTVDGVCHAVAAGAGIAILPRHSVQAWVEDHRIAAVAIGDTWADRRLLLACRDDDPSASTAALREHLLAAYAERPDRA